MTHDENNELTGVSPGTPLHRALSRFWYPLLRSAALADRHTHKARLLGESFVIARRGATLIAHEEHCPHRQASLTLGRVEDGGLRCIYHGWLIGDDGSVRETPNERESGGREQVRVRTPQVRDAGGLIWLNICEHEAERAPFPDLPWMTLPAPQVVIAHALHGVNWVQALEGAIDSSHTSHLHSDQIVGTASAGNSTPVGRGTAQFARPSVDKHPRIRVRDTDFGFVYGALRKPIKDPESMVYIRATAFAFPAFVTFPMTPTRGDLQIFVPIDEHHSHFFYVKYSTAEPLDAAALHERSGLDPEHDVGEDGYLRVASLPMWGQDRAAVAAGQSFTGLKGVSLQDIVVQASMGPVVDRTREHLGGADVAIVHFRRMLLAAARGEGAGTADFAKAMQYGGLRARDGLLPLDQDWIQIYGEGEINWREGAEVE